jgi:AcrR family transcriptional regulator
MRVTGDHRAKATRRREILAAAFAEFSSHGYAGASMVAIARRARASKETLYAWFSDKETLFATVLTDRMEAMSSHVSAAVSGDPPPEDLLPVVAENVLRLMITLAPLTHGIQAGAGEKALRLLGKSVIAERSRFVDYLLRCRARGQVAFDDDPFELVSTFVAMAVGEWSLRLATGITARLTDKMIAEHARRVTRLFLKALAP